MHLNIKCFPKMEKRKLFNRKHLWSLVVGQQQLDTSTTLDPSNQGLSLHNQMAYSYEGAILANDGILVLNDGGQTVFAISDSGSLDGNYTFYQIPGTLSIQQLELCGSTDGVYTHLLP